jgi:RNA-binding protein
LVLTSKRRAELKTEAHDLEPVAHIGKYGVTPESLAHIDKALSDHALIKVKFLGFKERRAELSSEIAGATSSTLIDVIGNVAILYREKPETSEK